MYPESGIFCEDDNSVVVFRRISVNQLVGVWVGMVLRDEYTKTTRTTSTYLHEVANEKHKGQERPLVSGCAAMCLAGVIRGRGTVKTDCALKSRASTHYLEILFV